MIKLKQVLKVTRVKMNVKFLPLIMITVLKNFSLFIYLQLISRYAEFPY